MIGKFWSFIKRKLGFISTSEGITALMKATQTYCRTYNENDYKTIETLLASGADVDKKSIIKEREDCTEKLTPFVYAMNELIVRPDKKVENQRLCHLFLDHGANPFSSKEMKWEKLLNSPYIKEDGYDGYINYFLLCEDMLQKDYKPLYDRCMAIVEKSKIVHRFPDVIGEVKDEKIIEKVLDEALLMEAEHPVESLFNAFKQNNNLEGIDCLVKLVKPQTPGYAFLHHQLVVAYLESANQVFNEVFDSESKGKIKDITQLTFHARTQVNEYRELVITHCLKGFASQEKPDATVILNELKRLYHLSLAEWKKEKPEVGKVNMNDVDIMDEVASNILATKLRLRK